MAPNPSIQLLFPGATIAPPATQQTIAAVEATLGVALPAQLRRFYLQCDGFQEDRGGANYLLALMAPAGVASLVSTTRFYWDEWPDYFPQLDLRPFVFFGMSGNDYAWAIDWARGERIIRYHHHLAGEYEVAGTDIVEVWRNDYAGYGAVG